MSPVVEETEAERLEHSEAGVVGGASPNTDDEMAATPVEGLADQLAGAIGGRFPGISFFRSQEGQATDGSHFDIGGLAISGEGIAGIDESRQGIVGTGGDISPVGGGDDCFQEPLATIGDGKAQDLAVRKQAMDCLTGSVARLTGGEATFERVDRDTDFLQDHDCSF